MDYFGARYFNSSQGRWLSPDWSDTPEAIPYSNLNDPQSLNLYGYVRNNPIGRADADGHDVWDFLVGVGNSVGSNAFLGAGRNDYGNDDYKMGEAVGDFASTLIGAGESLLGGTIQGGGVAACGTGVGCLVGAPAIVGGGVMEVHGAGMATSGFVHLAKSATSGENEYAKAGREAHKNHDPGPGYEKEVTLPSGRRADVVNQKKATVRELKPNNPRAIRKGQRQVEKSRQELQRSDPKQRVWKGRVDTYER